MSKILITGGAGYIGSALAKHLERDNEVVVIDTRIIIDQNSVYHYDYRSLGIVQGFIPYLCVSYYDVIIHLAAHSIVKECEQDPYGAFRNNVEGFCTFLQKLYPGQKLIYASTGSLYTEGVGGSSASFRNMYDFSKYADDALVKLLRPENSIGLRLGTVCGVSPRMRWDTMVNGMVRSAVTEKVVRVSNPHVRRPLLAMKDLCRAVETLIEFDSLSGILDLSSFSTTVENVAKVIAREFSVPIERLPDGPAYDFDMKDTTQLPMVENLINIIDDLRGIL